MRMYFSDMIFEHGMLSVSDFLAWVADHANEFPIAVKYSGKRKQVKTEYYNIPAAFDIETSSFRTIDGEKRGVMYIWQFGLYGKVCYGRDWEHFEYLLYMLRRLLCLDDSRILIVYVHNLQYEYQWIRKLFKWDKVFLLDNRAPVYSLTQGVEFRCSLKLAGGVRLETVGKNLVKYHVEKLVGDLDYTYVRGPETPLTEQELAYCENDIRVLLAYIQEKIENDGDITKIPLTNTGYVRNYCREKCFERMQSYKPFISTLVLTPEIYKQAKQCYSGGFTHANAHYVLQCLEVLPSHCVENVASYDFNSSYPAVMLLEKFPVTPFKEVTRDTVSQLTLPRILKDYCCMFTVTFYNVAPKIFQDHPISYSKCLEISKEVLDNGRVVKAEKLTIVCTELDYQVYHKFYDIQKEEIRDLRIAEKQYLPKPLILAILKLYGDKTKLKGIVEKQIEYLVSKGMVNACYGMMATDMVREEYLYIQEKEKFVVKKVESQEELAEAVEKANNNFNRFLYYPWGIWVTSYARYNLFTGIEEMGEDYLYSDTDSLKILNHENHAEYFKRYNDEIIKKIGRVSSYYHIDSNLFMPEDIKGNKRIIGVWDYEGVYDEFKSLGAKRYMIHNKEITDKHRKNQAAKVGVICETPGKVYGYWEITMAGVNKFLTMKYLVQESLKLGCTPFDLFTPDLTIPSDYSGRLAVTYIDEPTTGYAVDYLGHEFKYLELSSVNMEKTDYDLSMKAFLNYLQGVWEQVYY